MSAPVEARCTPGCSGLTAEARIVWSRRHALAMRPHEAARSDRAIRGWLLGLPIDAYVYDLRVAEEPRAAGRTEWRAPRVGCIAADGCRCLRSLDCQPKAGGRRYPRSRVAPTPGCCQRVPKSSFAIETPQSGRTALDLTPRIRGDGH